MKRVCMGDTGRKERREKTERRLITTSYANKKKEKRDA